MLSNLLVACCKQWLLREHAYLVIVVLPIFYTSFSFLYRRVCDTRFQQKWNCVPAPQRPTLDPFIGTDLFLRYLKAYKEFRLLDEMHSDFRNLQMYTFQFTLGGDRIIMTIEPENIQHVLVADANNYCMGSRRQATFKALHGTGVFTLEGPEWQKSRKDIKLSLEQVQRGLITTLQPHVDHLLKVIPRDGTAIDLQRLFELLTLDTTTQFLWGESAGALANVEASTFLRDFDEVVFRAQEGTGRRFNYGWFRFLLTPRQYWRDVKYVHDFIDSRIRAYMRRNPAKGADSKENSFPKATLLDRLSENKYDNLRIRGELLQILMAGRDTTAALLSNAWFEIARHPNVLARLQQEVGYISDAETITLSKLKGLKYLQAVLAEALRLYPPIPYNVREATQNTWIPKGSGPNGQTRSFVPKGSIVAWSLYSLHRRQDVYGEDAGSFRPERWLGDNEEMKVEPGWAFLPFNGGQRTCPGQAHAIMEASYTSLRLLREFKTLEWQDSGEWQEFMTLTCTNRRGCRVVLR